MNNSISLHRTIIRCCMLFFSVSWLVNLLRIAGLQKFYPNLIQVPEQIIDLEFVVFTKQASFLLTDWHSLKPYSLATIYSCWIGLGYQQIFAQRLTPFIGK